MNMQEINKVKNEMLHILESIEKEHYHMINSFNAIYASSTIPRHQSWQASMNKATGEENTSAAPYFNMIQIPTQTMECLTNIRKQINELSVTESVPAVVTVPAPVVAVTPAPVPVPHIKLEEVVEVKQTFVPTSSEPEWIVDKNIASEDKEPFMVKMHDLTFLSTNTIVKKRVHSLLNNKQTTYLNDMYLIAHKRISNNKSICVYFNLFKPKNGKHGPILITTDYIDINDKNIIEKIRSFGQLSVEAAMEECNHKQNMTAVYIDIDTAADVIDLVSDKVEFAVIENKQVLFTEAMSIKYFKTTLEELIIKKQQG